MFDQWEGNQTNCLSYFCKTRDVNVNARCPAGKNITMSTPGCLHLMATQFTVKQNCIVIVAACCFHSYWLSASSGECCHTVGTKDMCTLELFLIWHVMWFGHCTNTSNKEQTLIKWWNKSSFQFHNVLRPASIDCNLPWNYVHLSKFNLQFNYKSAAPVMNYLS